MSSDPTFGAILAKRASQQGDAIALISGEQQVSYGELNTEVERIARGFVAMGLAARDRVAIFLDSSIEAVVAILAAWSAGLVAVLIQPRLKPPQVAHILEDCRPALLVTSPGRHQQIATRCHLSRLRVITSFGDLGVENGARQHRSIDIDAATSLYTSGSTGQPKGVVISHRNLTSGAASVADYLGLTSDDVILAVLPLSFDAGLSQLTTGPGSGATIVLHSFLRPNDLAATCARHAVTCELPSYMHPVLWQLPELARSPNGKIDRQGLRVHYRTA